VVTPAQTSRPILGPGDKLGKHEIVRQIAVGAMAELYLTRTVGSEGFEKLACVKRILPQYIGNPSFVGMFLNEARLAATLHHPNIAQVYDISQDNGEHFFSMEYVHGEDLGRLEAAGRDNGVPISLDCALTIVAGLCAGLHHAHDKASLDGKPLGVVHRDVSPSNVLISYDGAVKLVDFGIARAGGEPSASQIGLKGKASFLSPEQIRGRGPVDRRSDVFSVGTILYELTTGQLPFDDVTEFGILEKIVDRDPERPSALVPGYSPALEAIVMRALQRDPDRRYPTALALQNQLEDFAENHRLRISPLVLARLMSTLFPARLEEWDHARAQGAFFVEEHVVRTLIESGKTADSSPREVPEPLPQFDDTGSAAAPLAGMPSGQQVRLPGMPTARGPSAAVPIPPAMATLSASASSLPRSPSGPMARPRLVSRTTPPPAGEPSSMDRSASRTSPPPSSEMPAVGRSASQTSPPTSSEMAAVGRSASRTSPPPSSEMAAVGRSASRTSPPSSSSEMAAVGRSASRTSPPTSSEMAAVGRSALPSSVQRAQSSSQQLAAQSQSSSQQLAAQSQSPSQQLAAQSLSRQRASSSHPTPGLSQLSTDGVDRRAASSLGEAQALPAGARITPQRQVVPTLQGMPPIGSPFAAPPVPAGGTLVSSATLAGKPPPAVKPVPGPFGSQGLDGNAGRQSGHHLAMAGAGMELQGGVGRLAVPVDSIGIASGGRTLNHHAREDVTERVTAVARTPAARHGSRAPYIVIALVGVVGAAAGIWLALSGSGEPPVAASARKAESAEVAPPVAAAAPAGDRPAEVAPPVAAAPPAGDRSAPSGASAPSVEAAAAPGAKAAPSVEAAAGPAAPGTKATVPSVEAAAAVPGPASPTATAVVDTKGRAGLAGAATPGKPAPAAAKLQRAAKPAAPAGAPATSREIGADGAKKRTAKVVQPDPRAKVVKPKVRPDAKRNVKSQPKEQPWSNDSPFMPEATPKR
jgi:serine/threonine protein kinase